ncbi:MAG TPA: acyl carrier protein [Bacteroidia bacterium]|nr:acyl carrier protein [Bacteroidia bacterium]
MVKLLSMAILILLLLIPSEMVQSLINERQQTHDSALDEISSKWGFEQHLSGPVINVPYQSFFVDEGEVTNEASFTNDLGADSLDTVELIMEFEKEFNIAIPDDQAEKISTVGQAVDYITANVK